MIISLKKGGNIHIKEKNKGKFTSYCGGKVTSACIAKAKASGNSTLVKRATFAANARKWKHLKGGILLKYLIGGYMLPSNVLKAINNGSAAGGLMEGFGRVMSKILPEWMLKAGTYMSPLNYTAALSKGSINPKVGEEVVSTWHPNILLAARLGEAVFGGKAIKNTPKAVVNTAAKAGVKPAKAAVVARKINKVVNETNDLSKLLAFDLFQELTSAPTSKITRLRPEFSLAMQDKNYVFGKLLWSTNLTKGRYATPLTKHIKVMDTKQADPQIYVTQALYPLAIENGGLRAAHGGQTRPIWLNSNKPYFGTPTGVSNSTNYTYIIDANKFTPELNLLRNIGGTHYEFPGTAQLPIEGTKRILWDPVLLQYTSTIFTEAPKSEISSTTSLKFFERKPSKISEAERAGVPKGERNVKQGYLLKDAIEEANKFAEKWGYDKLSQDATLLDIENLYNQHNTFFRGVTTEQLENTRNRVAKELGINPELLTNDLYLLYVSTHPWPGNDRIWVTPFSHYGKIYGNSDIIGGKGLLSAVMRPWKTTKDIKQWPKLSLWTLGFKEDVSNPVITPWVSNAPDAIRSLGALSEFLVKPPLIYRGLGKNFKGTFLLHLKYKDNQGKLGWIESLVGELPLEIIIEKQGGKLCQKIK